MRGETIVLAGSRVGGEDINVIGGDNAGSLLGTQRESVCVCVCVCAYVFVNVCVCTCVHLCICVCRAVDTNTWTCKRAIVCAVCIGACV